MLLPCLGDSDYTDVNQMLLFIPGEDRTQCFDVPITNDSIYEQSERFSLSLNPLKSAHIQLTNSTVIVEILDDEGAQHSTLILHNFTTNAKLHYNIRV